MSVSDKTEERDRLCHILRATTTKMSEKRHDLKRFVMRQALFMLVFLLLFFCFLFNFGTIEFTLLEIIAAVIVSICFLMELDALFLRVCALRSYKNLYFEGQNQLGELIQFMDWTGMRRRQLYKGSDPKVLEVIKQFLIIELQEFLSPVRKGRKYIWWFIYGFGFLRLSLMVFICYLLLGNY